MPGSPSVHLPAVHSLHRNDAGTVCSQQLRPPDAGRFLRGNAGRKPLHRPHGRPRQCHVLLYRTESWVRADRPGPGGLSCCPPADRILCRLPLPVPGIFPRSHYRFLPGQRRNQPCLGDRKQLSEIYRLFLRPHRTENVYRRPAAGRGRHEALHSGQPGQSLPAGDFRRHHGSPIRYRHGLVCRAFGMAWEYRTGKWERKLS